VCGTILRRFQAKKLRSKQKNTLTGVLIAGARSPDILHIHGIGPSVMVPIARMLRMKVIVTNHGAEYLRRKWSRLARIVLKTGKYLAARFCHKMIVISEGIKDLVERKYRRQDLEYIANGVNDAEIIPPGTVLV